MLKKYPSHSEIDTSHLRCWIEVNLSSLKHNIEIAQKILPQTYNLMCVVKANAYGLGDIEISEFLQDELNIKYFAVATIFEALRLREKGNITGEILILGYTPIIESEVEQLIKYNFTQTLISLDYAKKLNNFLEKSGKKVKCHMKIESGMNRIGENCIDELREILQLKNLKIEGTFSHLCRADDDSADSNKYTEIQLEKFNKIINQLKEEGYNLGKIHIQNSFGILRHEQFLKEKSYDLARPGIMMYGVSDNNNDNILSNLPDAYKLKGVVSYKCKVGMIKEISKGEKVGYGSKFTADENTKVATLTIGYADGLYRLAGTNGLNVLINGFKCPILGRICMDMCMVKIPNDSGIKEGDVVTFYGWVGDEYVGFYEFAEKCGTGAHEILTKLPTRITRIYYI